MWDGVDVAGISAPRPVNFRASLQCEAAGVVSGLANKMPRARSSSSIRSSSASRGSSHSVSGPPPRGPASSKDEPPAQGLPAQGRELIQLQGKNAKDTRVQCPYHGVGSCHLQAANWKICRTDEHFVGAIESWKQIAKYKDELGNLTDFIVQFTCTVV